MKRKNFVLFFALLFGVVACNKMNQEMVSENVQPEISLQTKAYGDKTPKIVVYVETNDVNPVNVIDYYMGSNTSNMFVDIVELFAANIHVDDNGDPCIYFNDKLAPVMDAPETYIEPIQNAGIKVVLSVLGDWQHMGVASMSDSQATKFAKILAYIVNTYNLDGIGFDDEYADYSSVVSGSYGNVIEKLRAELGSNKLITVFDYGYTSQISSSQGALIDYAYTNFSYWNTSSTISGMTSDRWAPSAYNLGSSYSSTRRSYITSYASDAADGGYGAIMLFNLRTYSDVSPLPVFNAIASGAFNSTVSRVSGGGNRTRAEAGEGVTITYDDI